MKAAIEKLEQRLTLEERNKLLNKLTTSAALEIDIGGQPIPSRASLTALYDPKG